MEVKMHQLFRNASKRLPGWRVLGSNFPNTTKRHASSPSVQPSRIGSTVTHKQPLRSARPLQKLPISQLFRTHLIMSISSSPRLLDFVTWIINRMLGSPSAIFDPDRNRLLRWVFQQTFYKQFCAGEDRQQVQRTISALRDTGYDGVVLEYASEVLDEHSYTTIGKSITSDADSIKKWRTDVIETVEMAGPGDCVALKWSGMGESALRQLKSGLSPSTAMWEAMTAVCDIAAGKGVLLLPAAEQQYAQARVDRWTLDLATKYNRLNPGHAVIYNTYQTYLKSSPSTLSKHLSEAVERGFTLGVKLVRGAYLESERRELIWDTKAETDKAYDGMVADLLRKQCGTCLKAENGADSAFPSINVVLATHNLESTEKARAIRDLQEQSARDAVPLIYAQLHGMADEVSCALLQAREATKGTGRESPRTFKYTAWGTTRDCLSYLLRRAAENRDAITRTRSTRKAVGAEMRQRFFSMFR